MGKSNTKPLSRSWMARCLIASSLLLTLNMAVCTGNHPRNWTANTSMSLVEYLKATKYDKTVRPKFGSGKPTEVFLDLYVETFGNIKEVNMEFPVFMYFRQMWYDERISEYVNSSVSLQRDEIKSLWFPDTFCYNAKKSDLMLQDTEVHSVIRIDPDGLVFYSRSSQIVASCEMDLLDFPMDTQLCKLTFGSYGHPDSDILIIWRNSTVEIGNKEMAQFSVGDATLSTKTNQFVSGNFTSLTVTFPFKRRMGYYIIQVYIPCVFLVMLSWIVFWMRPDDSASRLTVGITTILTIVFLLGYTNGMLPKVSYVKGMDWYLMVCFTIIFLSLLECIVVDRLWRASNEKTSSEKGSAKKKQVTRAEKGSTKNRHGLNFRYLSGVQILRPKKTDTASQTTNSGDFWNVDDHEQACDITQEKYKHLSLDQMQRPLPMETLIESDQESMHYDTVVRCLVKRNSCPMEPSAKVDKASRVLFPLTFLVYNIAYWLTYYYEIRILSKRI
ncbi:hypothetical protein ABFA07_021676 [Porites harrisoni]